MNTLHLSNITLEDAGEYICMAENTHAGQTVQAMQSAWLEVLAGETLHKYYCMCHQNVTNQSFIMKDHANINLSGPQVPSFPELRT